MAFGDRPNSGPDDPVFIGIRTNATGRVFDGQANDFKFVIDPSHGDGFGGLSENQRNVYIQLLRAALDRMEKERPVIHMAG